MGLVKNNGNYLRITEIRFEDNTVNYEIYATVQIREDQKNGILNEFYQNKRGSWNTDVIKEVIANATPPEGKGILDGLKTLCYQKMLEDTSAFGDWVSDEQ